ncbi:MAG: hypothetical protein QOI66_190 [Myxococcales bacterium]|jgi:hypothetical protein|nr:hypothetical protein [Myxococcales bacterium]
MKFRALLLVGAIFTAACASEPPPRPRVASHAPRPAPVVPVETAAPIIDAAAAEPPPPSPVDLVVTALGVEKDALVWSPTKKTFAVVVPVPAPSGGKAKAISRRPKPVNTTIAVYAPTGDRLATFRAVRPGPVTDLRYLGEDRLFYQLSGPPRPPLRRPLRGPAPPVSLRYAIQSLKPGAVPIPCSGWEFVFSPAGNHVAWLTGDAKHQRLFADGQPVYPRRGWTTIQGQPAWSHDGVSLAAIENGLHRRLVVLVEFDNPSGDNTWPLPIEANDPSLHVYWAGPGKLVVGPSLTKPVFAASYLRDPAPVVSMPAEPAATSPGRP